MNQAPGLLVVVSGHGFGHATRMAALLTALRRRRPDLRLAVCTACPHRVFLPPAAPPGIQIHDTVFDFGMRQTNSVTLDLPGTLAGLAELAERTPEQQRMFNELLAAFRPAAVLADIPAAPLAWAAAAGLPAIGISNFTWDVIYAELGRVHAGFLPHAAEQAAWYARADALLRLPFGPAPRAFNTVVDIPLLARRVTGDRSAIRRLLGLSAHDRIIVLSFGGFAMAAVRNFARSFPADWQFLSWSQLPAPFPGRLTVLDAESSMPHEAVTAAADIVIGKPGYGTVSECLAAQTKFLYVPRPDYPECAPLTDGVERHGVARSIPAADFMAGRWHGHIAALLADDRPWPALRLDGADVAAAEICRRSGW
ncbi:MAG TPA: hypothetical protein PKM88_12340 [bacterium]|nr:hypothetical protein [bacterium]